GLRGAGQGDVGGHRGHVEGRGRQRQGGGHRVLGARPEEPREELQGRVLVRPDLDARRSGRHDVAPPRPGRTARLLARGQVRRAGQRGALQRGREVPRAGLQGDDQDLPGEPAVAAGDPAVRGLRAAEVRGVHAEPEPAVRAAPLQPQAPSRVTSAPRPAPSPDGERVRGGIDMRGFLPFFGRRLLRALIALWLVSTVVFLVMRLSGARWPLPLPPARPSGCGGSWGGTTPSRSSTWSSCRTSRTAISAARSTSASPPSTWC